MNLFKRTFIFSRRFPFASQAFRFKLTTAKRKLSADSSSSKLTTATQKKDSSGRDLERTFGNKVPRTSSIPKSKEPLEEIKRPYKLSLKDTDTKMQQTLNSITPAATKDMTIVLTPKEQEICHLLTKVVDRIQADQPSKPRLVLRIAGGWVRDKLLGLRSHDLDIAIDNMSGYDLAQHVNAYLRDTGHSVRTVAKISQNPEKSKHLETATTSVLGLLVDFVNLRSETYNSDSRIPHIEFGTPLEDALRRDITINALFYNIETRQVEDFTGKGIDDLKNGIVRTPLEPLKTFSDDPLRVLRVIRFASRFGYNIDAQTSEAIKRPEIKSDLDAKISRERICVELEKMAAGPHPLLSIQMILEFGLYENIFVAPPREQWLGEQLAEGYRVSESLTKSVLGILDSSNNNSTSRSIVHAMPVSLFATDDSQMRRSLILASYLYPFYGLEVKEKKTTVSAFRLVVRDGLKLSNHDIHTTAALHTLAPMISHIAECCLDNTITRMELGLHVRYASHRWPMATVFSVAVELVGGADFDMVTRKYVAYIDRILAEGLQEAYALKHIVDGKQAAKILGIRPGPIIRDALDSIMKWQLQNPAGTLDDCEEFIKNEIAPQFSK
ncbi:CCA tRNA nucleotidyltransferase, mitochondrial [Coemansia erecta]|uniref:CCA tRNA nucleotidyltransferase, mitochondrial n=1 Tax=Coemansia asiatica TaxID=1052880 RepID=A0A9W8CIE6_9FUNG|nr:CCA tRNA nucleotidyltransferase, mitochondrial [Coemansia asiatica]KAJ2855381.1 CCA tRNA nucleotidyltransferase, mitochondrial [Coemansia erecta]